MTPKWSRARPLNFENLGDHTRPPLRITGATLLDILGVVGRNNVLAFLGVVHDGLGVREEAIESPVEETGGDKGVNVAYVETARVSLLAALRPSYARHGPAISSVQVHWFGKEGEKSLTGVDRPQ